MNKKEKYLILDFGKVIAGPATGDWNMTPKFHELIKVEALNQEKWQKALEKYSYVLSEKMNTLEEEESMFYKFYQCLLKESEYPFYDEQVVHEIAHNRTYFDDKYHLYEKVNEELFRLQKEYTLIMLTDNWPCVFDYLKRNGLEYYFEKVYVSSIYGSIKKEGTFFDYLIHDYHLEKGDAIFVDDNEENLDVAVQKGFRVFQMDRQGEVTSSKYPIIHDLDGTFGDALKSSISES